MFNPNWGGDMSHNRIDEDLTFILQQIKSLETKTSSAILNFLKDTNLSATDLQKLISRITPENSSLKKKISLHVADRLKELLETENFETISLLIDHNKNNHSIQAKITTILENQELILFESILRELLELDTENTDSHAPDNILNYQPDDPMFILLILNILREKVTQPILPEAGSLEL
jgi:hypothetical protein